MTVNNGLLAGLSKGANHFFNVVRGVLNGGSYPSGDSERSYTSIQSAMYVDKPQVTGDRAYIDVKIDMSLAPYAAAYEFGSGEHATVGSAEKYKIEPKNAKALALRGKGKPWTPSDPVAARRSRKYIDEGDDGTWIFAYVEHPGVEGKPYLRPTLEMEADAIAKLIGEEFTSSLMTEIFGDSPREEVIVVVT